VDVAPRERGPRGGPPTSPVGTVGHPRLAELARRADHRPLVTVTAGPGWGRTTFAAEWAAHVHASWCSLRPTDADPARFAATVLAAVGVEGADLADLPDVADAADVADLAARITDAWRSSHVERLVLDDAQHLAEGPALALLRALRDVAADGRQLVVTSTVPLELAGPRARAAGEVLELDATHLALGTARVERLLADELADDPPLAARLVDATGGWPAAVRLLVEALHDVPAADRSARVTGLSGPDGPVGAYVEEVVLPQVDDTTRRLLLQLAVLGPTAPSALVTGEAPDAARCLRRALAAGLARPDPSDADGEAVLVVPALRRILLERILPMRADQDELIDAVVGGLLDRRRIDRALEVLTLTRRVDAAADLLADHGEALLRSGAVVAVLGAAEAVPARRRDAPLERLHARALAIQGRWAAALRCLEAAGCGGDGPLDADTALGLGLVHHLRGDLDAALVAYGRGPDRDDAPAHAALLAWRATAHWLRGEVDDARRCAEAAAAHPATPADDHLVALTNTATALVAASVGDRRANEVHHDLALAAARRAGDELQLARILTNRGSRHLENGDHDEALRETDEAIDLADRQGFAMILGVARCNRAEILLRTGRLDEAIADAETARETFGRIGSLNESYAHHLLGDARREQGDLVLAELAYERALRLSDPSGDRQGRVPAHLGLARTLVGTDPDAAAAAVARAGALDDGMYAVEVRIGHAWVALARDERDEARALATAAREEAERRENKAGVAEAVTLGALLDDDPVPGLREAAQLWWEVGARISATRAELGVARRSDRTSERAEAASLQRRLAGWGCSADGGAFAHRLVAGLDVTPPTAIRVLGAFVVERDGRPVTRADWGSRKARELLKVLVVRDGRSIAREELADLLWPGEAYETVTNRLSVALSVVRGVLGGDGGSDAALVADASSVALDLDAVEVDVRRFRQLAERGLAAVREGDRAVAVDLLVAAEEAYGGDLLEEDRDTLWLVDRREEVRSLYVSVARCLAELVGDADPDRAMRLLLRVLDRDAYDELAHLGVCRALLRGGRHGEARRRHRWYAERMDELGLPAVPLHELARDERGADGRAGRRPTLRGVV
jgi:ATP/maltotriose-dependent transcriptional regulator MalT/DNA-binding SARP family transcriptional activator